MSNKLRAVAPEALEKRLKVLLYGAAGTGKSTACATFPRAYFIDTEKGIENDQYVTLLKKNGSLVFQTNDFDEMLKEVTALLTEKHDFKTLVIDSLTTIHNDLIDKMANKPGVGTEFGRHYSEANKRMKHLCNLLLRLDMNVIITSHSKTEYGQNLSVIGSTYDGYKKLDYIFDLVFEIQKRGMDRVAVTKKSRIESFPDGECFSFSYDEVANKYGREIIEREAIPIEFATPEQVQQLKRLMVIVPMADGTYEKWLDKAGAQTAEEMSKDSIQKCIDYLTTKQTQSEIN